MSSCLVLVDEDPKVQSALAYAFEREGAGVRKAASPAEALAFVSDGGVDLMIAGLPGPASADLARALRARPDRSARLPLVCVGDIEDRETVMAAGSTDFLARPVYLRDVVSLGGLHFAAGTADPRSWEGDLEDFIGLYYLVRALAAARRTGVLTLARPTRHGELRLVNGEVSSAAVGSLDGLAAFHQLLLWTDARFEFRHEDVTPRRQIPLEPAELLDDAQQFLRDFREVSAGLSPSDVHLLDPEQVAREGRNMPLEVSRVVKLFDGVRSLADVVEDSPFRVAETVKVTLRLLDRRLLRPVGDREPRGPRAALTVEDWLIGRGRDRERSKAVSGEIGGAPRPAITAAPVEPVSASASAIPSAVDAEWEQLGASLEESRGRKNARYASLVPSQTVTGEIGSGVASGAIISGPAPTHAAPATRPAPAPAPAPTPAPAPAPMPAPAPVVTVQARAPMPGPAAAAALAEFEGETIDVPVPPVDASRPQGIISGEISKRPRSDVDDTGLPSESIVISETLPREVVHAARAGAAEPVAAPTAPLDHSESRPHGRAFNDMEEEFFAKEAEFAALRAEPVESFDDDLHDNGAAAKERARRKSLFGKKDDGK